ncbi:hypothetical protein KDK_00240 [Dictyobacter kobayashii]|uniref:Uncharacterized protein n=1 Tax=Dictyobacter kobayashii TaxID=2014872 RepID=A0A402AAM9_9CHLR|nr:hypothetical protein KDK_00240 [Dictyobacter kobayashii]
MVEIEGDRGRVARKVKLKGVARAEEGCEKRWCGAFSKGCVFTMCWMGKNGRERRFKKGRLLSRWQGVSMPMYTRADLELADLRNKLQRIRFLNAGEQTPAKYGARLRCSERRQRHADYRTPVGTTLVALSAASDGAETLARSVCRSFMR